MLYQSVLGNVAQVLLHSLTVILKFVSGRWNQMRFLFGSQTKQPLLFTDIGNMVGSAEILFLKQQKTSFWLKKRQHTLSSLLVVKMGSMVEKERNILQKRCITLCQMSNYLCSSLILSIEFTLISRIVLRISKYYQSKSNFDVQSEGPS